MEAPEKITLDEAIRRIAHKRGCTLAHAAELVRADIELLEGAGQLDSPPPIDPPPKERAAKPQSHGATEDPPL